MLALRSPHMPDLPSSPDSAAEAPSSIENLAARSAAWLERIRSGEEAAWEELVREYAPLVLAVGREVGLGEADCEDVFQRTWIALYRQLPLIREPRGLPAWVQITARRLAWQHQRREASRGRREEVAEERDRGGEDSPLDCAAELELKLMVHHGLKELPERCRDLLGALYLEQKASSYDAVAERLQIPRGSLGPPRVRCLAQLPRLLARMGRAQ